MKNLILTLSLALVAVSGCRLGRPPENAGESMGADDVPYYRGMTNHYPRGAPSGDMRVINNTIPNMVLTDWTVDGDPVLPGVTWDHLTKGLPDGALRPGRQAFLPIVACRTEGNPFHRAACFHEIRAVANGVEVVDGIWLLSPRYEVCVGVELAPNATVITTIDVDAYVHAGGGTCRAPHG